MSDLENTIIEMRQEYLERDEMLHGGHSEAEKALFHLKIGSLRMDRKDIQSLQQMIGEQLCEGLGQDEIRLLGEAYLRAKAIRAVKETANVNGLALPEVETQHFHSVAILTRRITDLMGQHFAKHGGD